MSYGAIRPRQEELEIFLDVTFPKSSGKEDTSSGNTWKVPDSELEARIKAAGKDEKLTRLMDGSVEIGEGKEYPSPSEADAALFSKIAFYLGPDAEAIEKYALASKLARDKWKRTDYIKRSIKFAINGLDEFYQPKKEKSTSTNSKQEGNIPRGITAAELMDMDFPEPKFAIPDILTEGLSIFAGKPKMGKSLFALNCGLAIAMGGFALGRFNVEPGEVLYLALEDTARRLKSRICQMLVNGSGRPELLHCFTEWPRMDQGGLDILDKKIESMQKLRLVFIDTYQLFKPVAKVRQNSSPYEQDYQHINLIKKVADKYGIAICLIHHLRKMEADDVFDTISGTLGLTGAADSLLAMTRTGRGSVLHVRGRDLDQAEYALEFNKDILSWHILGNAEEVLKTQQQQSILDCLKDEKEPLSPAQIAEMVGLKAGYVRKILVRMVKDGLIRKEGYAKYIYM
jgi:hypothetical protein